MNKIKKILLVIFLLVLVYCGYRILYKEHEVSYTIDKYNIDINYLNTDNFQDEDSQKLINSDSYFSEGFGTPLLLVIGDGSIKDRLDGLSDTKHYIEFLKKNGYVD